MVHVQRIGCKRVAAIDLGTNTFHLLIADLDNNGHARLVHQETVPVKLGEGGINSGYIAGPAFERGINAVTHFKQVIDKFQSDEVRTAATSALRTAGNGQQFVRDTKRLTGIELRIIDGHEEARLIYEGVRKAVDISRTALVMDIGGGSVEFIIADDEQVFWKESFPIGAARLMDRFHHSDPLSEHDTSIIRDYLDSKLENLFSEVSRHSPSLLIGSAGAFETFALFQTRDFISGFDQQSLTFDIGHYYETSRYILASNHSERESDSRIAAVRTDMIVVATLLTNYILERTGINAMVLSGYSLKEGLLFDRLQLPGKL